MVLGGLCCNEDCSRILSLAEIQYETWIHHDQPVFYRIVWIEMLALDELSNPLLLAIFLWNHIGWLFFCEIFPEDITYSRTNGPFQQFRHVRLRLRYDHLWLSVYDQNMQNCFFQCIALPVLQAVTPVGAAAPSTSGDFYFYFSSIKFF